jgi:site-specific recombinase XerC
VVFLLAELKEMLEIYGIDKKGLVFRSQIGKKYNKRTIQQIVLSAAKKAGLEKKVTPHSLRHGFTTNLVEAQGRYKIYSTLVCWVMKV